VTEIRPSLVPPPSLVRSAHELAAFRRLRADSPSRLVFALSGRPRPGFEAEVIVYLAALGNLVSQGAVVIFDVPEGETTSRSHLVVELARECLDPSMDVRVDPLPAVGGGVALVVTVPSPDPPYLAAADLGGVRRGDCWRFRGGVPTRATRAELDEVYGAALRHHERLPRDPLATSADEIAGMIATPAAGALLAHRAARAATDVWREVLAGTRDPDEGAVLLERGCAIVALVGAWGEVSLVPRLRDAALRALRSVYLLASDGPAVAAEGVDAALPGELAISNAYLLGAIAAHHRDFPGVASVIEQTVPGRALGEYPLVDHPLFHRGVDASRTLQGFFDLALELASREPWVPFLGSADEWTNALCQVDLLAAVSCPPGSTHYPNFARFERSRVAPVVLLARTRPERLGPVLGARAGATLDEFLERIEGELSADFATFAPWWAWGLEWSELAPTPADEEESP
jgi:hypothetical protein